MDCELLVGEGGDLIPLEWEEIDNLLDLGTRESENIYILGQEAKGQILAAVGRDGNDQMYPIAWAVVGKENKDNWKWFIFWHAQELHLGDGSKITLISDMQKGLIDAVKIVLPIAEHRFCARHILANWGKRWHGEELKKRFWICAWSEFEEEFKYNLSKLGEDQTRPGSSTADAAAPTPISVPTRSVRPSNSSTQTTGFGVFIDLNTGMQTLNPGMSSKIVISRGTPLLQTIVCDDPNVVTRFPLPKEKALRKKKAKQPTGVQLREIQLCGNGADVRAPSQLPFQVPGMQFRGKPVIIKKYLQQ
ncbi:unnamed protein product [Cuscuta epithymum]|uniref:MULE transposase domain-containing protein n=1 Tax=Cuscuta epithymum TaxID=186058 RepID=A0AAV0CUV6_9ASTE|nr:unnamed protein product [Cuscuta epithymum]